MGHFGGYGDAGIKSAEIVEVIDAHTSPICCHLNGSILPDSAMSAHKTVCLRPQKSRSADAAKATQQMLSATSALCLNILNEKKGKIIEEGIGFPPYRSGAEPQQPLILSRQNTTNESKNGR